MRNVYDTHTGAIDDYLYGSAFLVVDDALLAAAPWWFWDPNE